MITASLTALVGAAPPAAIVEIEPFPILYTTPLPPSSLDLDERPIDEPAGPQIFGLGELDSSTILPGLRELVRSGVGEDYLYLEVGVASDGHIARCKVTNSSTASPFADSACFAFIKSGRYNFAPGNRMTGSIGYTGVLVRVINPPDIDPVLAQVTKGQGTAVTAHIDLGARNPIDRCNSSTNGITFDQERYICSRIIRSAAFKSGRFKDGGLIGRQLAVATLWLRRNPNPPPRDVDLQELGIYRYPSYEYPEAALAQSRRMPTEAGKFIVSMTQDDYPLYALRKEMSGRSTIEIGIGADGRIESCMPAKSSGFLYLDLAACNTVRKRGSFVDNGTVKRVGVYYVRKVIFWQSPD